MSVTAWPTADTLAAWLPDGLDLSDEAHAILAEIVADATCLVLERVDPNKLPTVTTECPRTIARAIVMEAARLLSRRDSTNGVLAFGEFAIRASSTDADVSRLLANWGLDAEP